MKLKKSRILIFEIVIILLAIVLFGNEFIHQERDTVSEISEYKCQIITVYEIENGFYNVIVKTEKDEVYSIKTEHIFYDNIVDDNNYHKCRVIKKYHRDKLYSTNVFLIF